MWTFVTDPPYYDSVQYSDLSNFFRVWLRLLLPKEADWRYDPLDSAVSEGNISGRHKYGKVLGEIWKTCYQALDKDRGRLIFTFHHWNHEAWAELTASLKSAGFVLANRYVVFSENPISVHIRDLKALKHDTILVLKPDVDATGSNRWLEPTRIDTSDSYTFCRDCGAALGWFLSTDLTEADIRQGWKHLLEGENNIASRSRYTIFGAPAINTSSIKPGLNHLPLMTYLMLSVPTSQFHPKKPLCRNCSNE